MIRSVALLLVTGLVLAGCIDRQMAQRAIEAIQTTGERVEVKPVMLNDQLPFRYPPALFASKVQGNVTIRIYIDSTGKVWPESTMVVHSSGYPALDSAAVTGSRRLRFRPAKLRGKPVGVSALLPVFYRYPGARPLPGDTVLPGLGARDSGFVEARDSGLGNGSWSEGSRLFAERSSPEPRVPSPEP